MYLPWCAYACVFCSPYVLSSVKHPVAHLQASTELTAARLAVGVGGASAARVRDVHMYITAIFLLIAPRPYFVGSICWRLASGCFWSPPQQAPGPVSRGRLSMGLASSGPQSGVGVSVSMTFKGCVWSESSHQLPEPDSLCVTVCLSLSGVPVVCCVLIVLYVPYW